MMKTKTWAFVVLALLLAALVMCYLTFTDEPTPACRQACRDVGAPSAQRVDGRCACLWEVTE